MGKPVLEGQAESLWLAFVPGSREVHRPEDGIASFYIQSWNGARDPNINKLKDEV